MKIETETQLKFRIANQFVEREARQYPGARSRHRVRESARELYQWHEKKAALAAENALSRASAAPVARSESK